MILREKQSTLREVMAFDSTSLYAADDACLLKIVPMLPSLCRSHTVDVAPLILQS